MIHKYKVGQKVVIKPKDGMKFGYANDMKVIYNKVVTIVYARETEAGGRSLYRIDKLEYNYGDDVLSAIEFKLGGKIL